MDVDDGAFGWAVDMKMLAAKAFPIKESEEAPREFDPEQKEDRRFDQSGRVGRPVPYTFECGYGTVPVEDPWPHWIERDKDGTILLDFNAKDAHMMSFPGVEFAEHHVFPFPWGNEALRKSLTDKDFMNKLHNIIAGMPAVPFFMFRPPLFMMLNGIGVGKTRFETHSHPPVAISTQVIFMYLQVLHVLEGSTHTHSSDNIAKINAAHITDVKRLTDKIWTTIGENADFIALTKRIGTAVNVPPGEDERLLVEFARYMVTYVLNYIKLLERKIFRLADRKIRVEDLVGSYHCEFALPDPRNPKFTHWFDSQTKTMQAETTRYLTLKFEQEELPMPAEPKLDPANSVMGISYASLKLLLYYLYAGA